MGRQLGQLLPMLIEGEMVCSFESFRINCIEKKSECCNTVCIVQSLIQVLPKDCPPVLTFLSHFGSNRVFIAFCIYQLLGFCLSAFQKTTEETWPQMNFSLNISCVYLKY